MRRRECLAHFGVLAAGWPAAVLAQEAFPQRALRMVVPFPPGGGVDVTTRIITDKLAARIGQPVVVDNRAGGAGSIGADNVAKAAPDGYTLLSGMVDTVVNNAALLKSLPYDPLRDLVGVTEIVTSPVLISAGPATSARTLKDFVQEAGASRGRLSYGSWGVGGTGHLVLESLVRHEKLDLVHAPYRGDAPVMQDLLGKVIAIGASSVSTAQQHIEKGSIRPLAVSGPERSPVLPNVPTLAELGYTAPIYNVMVWQGIFAPSRTPAAIVQKLYREIRATLLDADTRARLESRSFAVVGSTPEAFDAKFRRDFAALTALIRSLGIEAQ